MADETGVLVLAGTPIGRPDDAPARLVAELTSADVVAAEDTRRLRRLASDLGVTIGGRVVSYFDGNEQSRVPSLIEALQAGERVLVVTDAGMPSVSDPGYRLVAAAVAEGIRVTSVPGPSAVLTALAVRGCRSTGSASRASCLARAGSGRDGSPPSRTSRARWCSSRLPIAPRRRWSRWPRRSAVTARPPSAAS